MAGLKVKFLVPVRYGVGEELKDFAAGDVYEFPTSERDEVKELLDNNFAEKAGAADKVTEPEEDPAT